MPSENKKINVGSREELLSLSDALRIEGNQTEPDEEPKNRPVLDPGPSNRGFAIGLYQEHLEEIGFLFIQCKSLFADPEINWPEVAEFEERLLAHVDAIELGGDLALLCARDFLESDDKEHVCAAAYTLTTVNGHETIDDVLKTMENADEELIPYYVEALKHTPYRETSDRLIPFLSHARPEIRKAAAEVVGYRRTGDALQFIPLLQDENPEVVATVIHALERLNNKGSIPYLEQCLAHENTYVQQNATLALLRAGHQPALDHLSKVCKEGGASAQWAISHLALCGRAGDLDLMKIGLGTGGIHPQTLRAMGVLGNVDAVEILISELNNKDEEVRVAAGEALHLLTGAGLRETITVVEEIDLDELFEGEEAPEPTSEEVERVCTLHDKWRDWWNKNQSHFRSQVRWRYGKSYDFGLCIDEMVAENTKFNERRRAYLELVIRSGYDIPFEPDWSTARQKDALHQWQSWWKETKASFSSGKWYFHGSEL